MQTLLFTNQVAGAIDALVDEMRPASVAVLVDENTEQCVLPLLAASKAISDAHKIVIAAGDANKTIETLTEVWQKLGECHCTRHSMLINLGGGVVTDLGGFAAATFKRGIRFVNIPTTLLSAVDAAVGGKTGVNLGGLKNEVGAFKEAEAVIISTDCYATLAPEELRSGYAEMLKHALLSDEGYYNQLMSTNVADFKSDELLAVLEKSVNVKRQIVAEDPHERGLRKALNLGHTVGHAFESEALHRGKPVPHGYAVAWGLVVEAVLSHMLCGFPSEQVYRLADYVRENYGAFNITCDDYPALLSLMHHDKKSKGGEINCTLLKRVGEVKLDQEIDDEQMQQALDLYRDLMHI